MIQWQTKIIIIIEEKYEIIKDFENGECAMKLTRKYGVGKSTITDNYNYNY